MDPITLIVTALVAGAAQGMMDNASAMMKDAYASLKARVKKKLGGNPGAELVLAKHEQAPETWQAPLVAELAEAGADRDHELIATAKALLDLIGEAGGAGKYTVDVRGARGVQIGDHNRQDNVFNAPAEG
jgi:RIP homotypic interaction motif